MRIRFAVAADMRDYAGDNPDYFRGACEAIRAGGPVDFMICPGDIDPPGMVNYTIMSYLSAESIWYPVVGNHDAETPSDMAWLRIFNAGGSALPNIINAGPYGAIETCYSFDYALSHFIVLNEYYDGSSDTGSNGDVGDALLAWLVNDLAANDKPFVFVIGHEPAYPLPDEESGRLRHEYDSLNFYPDNRDRFWRTLAENNVTAYICGHTHNYSAALFDGVWQIDVGHARGTGDTGARSTFIIISVEDSAVMDVHRLSLSTGQYVQTSELELRTLAEAGSYKREKAQGRIYDGAHP